MALTRIGLNQSINLASNVTGTLPAANGGTGATSFSPGKILQVKSVNYSTAETITATSFTATGLTLDITPASSSNKILIICSPHIRLDRSTDNAACKIALYRDSTAIMEDDATNAYFIEFGGTSSADLRGKQSYEFLDSPSSTSSITYKLYIANQDAGSSGQVQLNWNSGNINSSLTLMEVSA